MKNNNPLNQITSLNEYLWEHIPISNAMGVKVIDVSQTRVVLEAPLANNINHKKTVFGGSLHAVATLSCWSLLHVNLTELFGESVSVQIIIASSEIKYLAPVSKNFTAECEQPKKEAWEYFIKMLNKKGKARLNLQAKIFQDDKLCVDYSGTFAAIKVGL